SLIFSGVSSLNTVGSANMRPIFCLALYWFEYKGELNGVTIIDDYAHHPTEIKATLNTAKKIDHNKVYCVFQPHTYTRTKTLFDEFTHCFNECDELILMDIYA
ncbi:UDP-N-acetylmuramate-L-alanine ligase, partial [human gut metagenome]